MTVAIKAPRVRRVERIVRTSCWTKLKVEDLGEGVEASLCTQTWYVAQAAAPQPTHTFRLVPYQEVEPTRSVPMRQEVHWS